MYPYPYYCTTARGSTYPFNLNRLVLLQKRVIRIIFKNTFDAHTDPIFRDLKLLKLDQYTCSRQGNSCTYTKRFTPDYFPSIHEVHRCNTRRAKSYYLPFCWTNTRHCYINYQGPKFFNTLSSDISSCSSVSTFSSKLSAPPYLYVKLPFLYYLRYL